MTRSSLKQQREQKGDEKPQQQKKRKNNNPFVFPEKKIPAVDKTPYIFRTPIDLITGSRTVRYFTPEEREAYEKKLKETEGFDVGKYPLEVMLSKPIREISLKIPTVSVEFSTEAAKMALRGYNRKDSPHTGLSSSSGCVRVLAVAGMLCIILPFRPRRMGRPILPVTSKLWFVILGGCISSFAGRRKNPN